MTDQSIPESAQCPSKIGRATRLTGKPLAGKSVLSEPEIAVKAVQPIPIVAPETANPILLPEAGLSSLSPTLTTTQATATPATFAPGASDATSLTTPSTTQIPEKNQKACVSTTGNRRSLVGKKPTHSDLMSVIRHDDLQLQIHQMQLEAYKPAMDALKRYLEIFGSQSPNFYMTKNKQVAAACQMNGLNDPSASRKQRIAAMTCYEMIYETIMRCLEMGFDKEQVKQAMNDAINRAAEFFGLGNKKAVAARTKTNKRKTK